RLPIQNVLGRLLISQNFLPRSGLQGVFAAHCETKAFPEHRPTLPPGRHRLPPPARALRMSLVRLESDLGALPSRMRPSPPMPVDLRPCAVLGLVAPRASEFRPPI